MFASPQLLALLPPSPERKHIAARIRNKAVPSIRAGHPWLFENSMEKEPSNGVSGDIAVLFDKNRNFLAAGLYDPLSPVRVKIFTHSQKLPPVGYELFCHSVSAAEQLRSGKIPSGTNAWRLIHGDSDDFPGLVADKYDHAVVLKFYSAALLPWAGDFARAVLQQHGEVDSLVFRLSRELQRLSDEERAGIQDGMTFSVIPDWDAVTQFRENGIVFESDLRRGQKTGFFLDQRENRMKVGSLARGCNVLNVFSYSGGFSLHAARGGAESVTSVDLDPHALELCQRNFRLNPVCNVVPHEEIAGDAFQVFSDLRAANRLFELVIVDPPSFAKTEAEVPRALNSYARLAKSAVRVLKPGGTLVFASCSSRVSADVLFQTIENTCSAYGRPLAIFDRTYHAPDHPAKFPESRYLKCLYAKA